MDFVTHAAVGALAGRAVAGRAYTDGLPASGARCARLGALVALVPDLDHVLEWRSAEAYLLHHRTASHSLLFVAACVALAVALPSRQLTRGRRALVVAAALFTHLGLDVLTPFGTGLLWPFTPHMLALDGLPIVAPWVLVLSLLPASAAAWAARERSRRRLAGLGRPGRALLAPRAVARLGLLALTLFLALESVVARRAAAAVPEHALAVPSWTWPLDARVFTREQGAVVLYRVGLGGAVEPVGRWPDDDDPHVRRAADAAAVPLGRMRVAAGALGAPSDARAGPKKATVVFEDVQYRMVDPGRVPFTVTVEDDGWVTVHQLARGAQPLVLLSVLGAVLLLTRRRPVTGT